MSILIPLEKLIPWSAFTGVNPWGVGKFTTEHVHKAIENNRLSSLPHDPSRRNLSTRRYHIQRIAWLAVNGWTDPIQIDVGVPELCSHVDWIVIDGNHRLAAAIVRGDKTISAAVSGSVGYALQLFGTHCEENFEEK